MTFCAEGGLQAVVDIKTVIVVIAVAFTVVITTATVILTIAPVAIVVVVVVVVGGRHPGGVYHRNTLQKYRSNIGQINVRYEDKRGVTIGHMERVCCSMKVLKGYVIWYRECACVLYCSY